MGAKILFLKIKIELPRRGGHSKKTKAPWDFLWSLGKIKKYLLAFDQMIPESGTKNDVTIIVRTNDSIVVWVEIWPPLFARSWNKIKRHCFFKKLGNENLNNSIQKFVLSILNASWLISEMHMQNSG